MHARMSAGACADKRLAGCMGRGRCRHAGGRARLQSPWVLRCTGRPMCTRVCLHELCAVAHTRTHVFSTRGSLAEGSASLEDSVCFVRVWCPSGGVLAGVLCSGFACCGVWQSSAPWGSGRGSPWRSIRSWLGSHVPAHSCKQPTSCHGRQVLAHERLPGARMDTGVHACMDAGFMHACIHGAGVGLYACSPGIPQAVVQAC